jgi:hypothetical protein
MGVGSDIYDSTATFGRFWALLGAIMATILGLGLIIAGIYFLVRKEDRNAVTGTILRINGSASQACPMVGANLVCTLTIQYVYQNETFTTDIAYNGPTLYSVGQTVTVYVLKTDPHTATIGEPVPKWMGGVFIGVGVLMTLGGWFWLWAARKWKVVAVAQGGQGLWNIVSGGNRF